MKKFLFFVCFMSIFQLSYSQLSDPYIEFLKIQNQPAKDYILNLFKKYDIVVLCERSHKEFTQYELILEIIKHPDFIRNIGNVYIESGGANFDVAVNKFLATIYKDSATARKSLTKIYRELADTPYWEPYSYPWLMWEMYKINIHQKPAAKLQLHPTSYSFDWNKCRSVDDYKTYNKLQRAQDSVMADNFMHAYEKEKQLHNKNKALVIMNYKHAFLNSHNFLGAQLHNTAELIQKRYANKVASVYIMGLAIPNKNDYTIIKDGKWDYYFEKINKENIGFDLNGNIFGNSEFDVIPPDSTGKYQYRFKDMFTGIIYYKPVAQHYIKTGWKDFNTKEFTPELRHRINIFTAAKGIDISKEEAENAIWEHNKEVTTPYQNLKFLREKIDKWKN